MNDDDVRWNPYRYLQIERPDGRAFMWPGPFDRPGTLLAWLRFYARLRLGDGSPLVPLDATWSVSKDQQP